MAIKWERRTTPKKSQATIDGTLNMARISKYGIQQECSNCCKRYNEHLDVCPHCKTVNLDKFNQRHSYRLYKIHEEDKL